MRVQLNNIGPIRSADIDLHPLTVLVGPNASGKTTFSTIGYAAVQAVRQANREVRFRLRNAVIRRSPSPRSLQAETDNVLALWEERVRDAFESEVRRCTFRELSQLPREHRGGRGAAPRIVISSEGPQREGWRLCFRISGGRLVLERSHSQYLRPQMSVEESDYLRQLARIDERLARALQAGVPPDALYFPASRSGFMQTYGALTALVFGALGGGFFEEASVGSIPGTAADFLRFLAQVRPEQTSRVDQSAVQLIEEELLHGVVELSQRGPARTLLFRQNGYSQSSPIEAAATSTAELSPLILYLRHAAKRTDAIFIDEPEAHLHPENQVQLARALARCAEAIGSVVAATHSEFLVAELSNVLMSRHLDASRSRDDGGLFARVYEFIPHGPRHGVVVEELDFDVRKGLDVRQFSEVADRTYEKAIEIHNAIVESESE